MKTKLPAKSKKIVPILQQFKTDLQKLYGDRFEKLILYGSYARGNNHELSDIDLLMVLTDMKSPYSEISVTSELTYSIYENYELYLSLVPTTHDRYEKKEVPLYKNIQREGVVI